MIHHLVDAATWDARTVSEAFAPASLGDEGFVHCTGDDETLLRVANTFYCGLDGEVLVVDLDERAITSDVRWEAPVPAPPAGTPVPTFPHVYGPLDAAAVVAVRRFVRDGDGRFVGYEPRT